jgi:hypothetical protein
MGLAVLAWIRSLKKKIEINFCVLVVVAPATKPLQDEPYRH